MWYVVHPNTTMDHNSIKICHDQLQRKMIKLKDIQSHYYVHPNTIIHHNSIKIRCGYYYEQLTFMTTDEI